MHTLGINFVQRTRISSSLGLFLFAIGLAAVGAVAVDYFDAREELERVQAKQVRLQRPDAASHRKEGAAPAAQDDAQAVERVASQLRMPWGAMLHEIELRADPAVALLSVEVQGQKRSLRLIGEAKEMADVVAYVTHLRESPWIKAAYLSGHEEKQEGAIRLIRFSMDATWSESL